MRWPWQQPEKRESQPFTDAITAAITASAAGTTAGDPGAIAALEAAAGLYASAFAGARLEGPDNLTTALTPAVRALLARNIIRRGESVFLIDLERGRPILRPVGSWDVRGGHMPSDWFIRCDLFGPSGNVTRFVPHAAVIHARYSVDPARPWLGIGPLGWARHTGALAANLELRLSEEAGGPSGYLLPAPEPETDEGVDADGEPVTDALSQMAKDVGNLKGKTRIVPSMQAGWSGDIADRPAGDWKVRRIGMDPPQVLPTLRSDAAEAVLAACQVPAALVVASADGTAQREAWRRWAMGPLQGLAAIIEAEIVEKLDARVTFDFAALWAHDIQGRATAFQKYVAGGMDVAKAAAVSGALME